VLLAVDVPQEVSDEIARRAQNVTGERVDVEPVQSESVPTPKTGKEG
jgi:2'-5' RNA ligase